VRLLVLQFISLSFFCSAQTKTSSTPVEIYERSQASIVVILTADDDAKPIGQGSGFIVSQDRIVTNHHVLEGASSVIVVFADGTSLNAEGIIADSSTRDLTILSVKTGARSALKLGDELSVHQGDPVYAIGAPRGLELSITNGIVSGFRRLDEQFLIQSTAPIAPGSSGGPLFNQEGYVIGVTTLLLTDSPGIYFSVGSGDVGRLIRAPDIIITPFTGSSARREPNSRHKSSGSADPSHSAAHKPDRTEVSGTYDGKVQNATANIGADFSIVIARDKEKLQGCMLVQRPLFGSGPLRGYINGKQIWFEVAGPLYQIRFQGTVTNKSISGTYQVLRPASQNGFFQLDQDSLIAPPTPFNPTKCRGDDSNN
jgi:S1-C subfamily serine protease